MIGIGLIVWEAYDFYNTCQEEGLDAAVLKLGFSLAAMAVGAGVIKRGYKLGTFFVETAPEALAYYKKIHPVFAKFYDIAAAAVAKGVQKVKEAATKFQAFDAKLESRLGQVWINITHKADAKLFSEVTSKDLVTHLDPKYWNKRIEYKGNTVYQRNDLIDPKIINKKGISNLHQMKMGKAPHGIDGEKIELHHMLQTQKGPIAEVTQTFHQQYTKIIHINPSSIPSGINRSHFKTWRENYWKERAKDFEQGK